MKTKLLTLIYIFAANGAFASPPEPPPGSNPTPEVIATLPVDHLTDSRLSSEPDTTVTYPPAPDGITSLLLTWRGHGQTRMRVLSIPPDLLRKITAARFGITGEMRCSQQMSLSLGIDFVRRVDPTPPFDEPSTDVSPTKDWAPFEIQIDRGHSGLILDRLSLWVDLYNDFPASPPIVPNNVTVELRDLRLVQYPNASLSLDSAGLSDAYSKTQSILLGLNSERTALLVTFKEDSPAIVSLDAQIRDQQATLDAIKNGLAREKTRTLDWHAFFLGAAAAVLFLLAGLGLFLAVRQWAQRRHERDLRRIASLDG